jgi:hypothetical protein
MQNVGAINVLIYLPIWLELKICIFLHNCFFIKGCSELRAMDFDDLSLLFLFTSIVLRFCQGISKNWKIDIIQCFANQHRLVVDWPMFAFCRVLKYLLEDSQWRK